MTIKLALLSCVTVLSVLVGCARSSPDLIIAADRGDVTAVKAMLERDADVNATDPANGGTALFFASEHGNVEMVQLLLAKGANVDTVVGNGSTALVVASQRGYRKVVQLLLAKGAQVNAKGGGGVTSLILAAEQGHSDVVRMLIAGGADVNATRDNGATAAMLASRNNHPDVVRVLRANGANPNEDAVPAITNAAQPSVPPAPIGISPSGHSDTTSWKTESLGPGCIKQFPDPSGHGTLFDVVPCR